MNDLTRLREAYRASGRAYAEARNAYDAARDAGGDDAAVNMGRTWAAVEAAESACESAYERLLEAAVADYDSEALP